MKHIAAIVLAGGVVLCCAAHVGAQTRAPRAGQRPASRAAEASQPPSPVDVAAVFSVGTGLERWAIDDPMPRDAVQVAGRRLSFDARLVKARTGDDGETQMLFPVSWHEAYAGANPDLRYVLVRYKDGKAFRIVAEYLPERLALPRHVFQQHPDGRSLYADLSVVRQNGRLYTKQAVSQGTPAGPDGVWVETVVLTATDDPTAAARQN